MEDITHAVVESVPNIPITVKIRGGWDNNNIISIHNTEEEANRIKRINDKEIFRCSYEYFYTALFFIRESVIKSI
ncbi:MAG: hypothetical protein QGG87_06405 [Nitrospinota bacterium]|nr:hypothetical protein [Nitrospinota bacterium]